MTDFFDIFSGTFKKAWWIEAVEGLSNGRERMQQIAKEKPGEYFLFCTRTHASVAEIHTFAIPYPQPLANLNPSATQAEN
jgi:hypothetical protein